MTIDPPGALAPRTASSGTPLRPASTSPASLDGGFQAVLNDVHATPEVDKPSSDPTLLPLGKLMELLTILLILGLEVPRWMLVQLRAHGLAAFADSLEARNVQIRNERLEERDEQLRRELLAAQRAS
jgi:hypothetical protein